jgi:uncharacterized protein YoxC
MSDDVFRLVITAAVLLASIAFVVQAGVVIAFYSTMRKMQVKVGHVGEKLEALADKIEPMVETTGPVLKRIGPLMDSVTQGIERMKPAIDRTVEVIGKIGVVVDQAAPVMDNARQVVAHANDIVVEARPHIAHFSEEAVGAARAAREQVERVGDIIHDASNRAHARLEQIDTRLEQTVGQVVQVGDTMKRVVMRPVREANGVAAGISAVVSTLVHPRRPPGAATQDEEMFI